MQQQKTSYENQIKNYEKQITAQQNIIDDLSQSPEKKWEYNKTWKNAVALVNDCNSKIVPFVIDGTYKVYEQQGKLKKADVVFSILPPIEVSTDEDPKELSAKTKALIQAELDRIRGKEND